MTERVHSDELPVSDTPETDALHDRYMKTKAGCREISSACMRLERRARAAETKVNHLNAVIEGKNGQWSREWHRRVEAEARAEKAEGRVAELECKLVTAPYRCECGADDVCKMALRITELERELAWVRAGPWASVPGSDDEGWWPEADDFHRHLASKPPEDWKP